MLLMPLLLLLRRVRARLLGCAVPSASEPSAPGAPLALRFFSNLSQSARNGDDTMSAMSVSYGWMHRRWRSYLRFRLASSSASSSENSCSSSGISSSSKPDAS